MFEEINYLEWVINELIMSSDIVLGENIRWGGTFYCYMFFKYFKIN